MVTLTDQIAAFKQALPDLRREHGSAWAVLVDNKVKGAFSEFGKAADYALANYAGQEFLIRHTDERVETVPFLVLERQ